MGIILLRILTLATVTLAAIGAAAAENYPHMPVSIVTGLAPGSITDVVARYLSGKLEQLAGRTFIVINKVGANGIIAANEVVRSKADGYTLLWAASSAYVSNQLLYKNHPYDPKTDLRLVSTMTQFGFVVAVNKENPVSSIDELTAQLRKRGGGMYGTSSTNMLAAAEMYKSAVGLDTQQVLYRSTADSTRDLMNGQLDFVIVDAAYGLAQAQQGNIKLLAVSQAKRSPLAPDIPTMDEAGLKGYEVNGWMALGAPAHTPPDVVLTLHRWMQQIAGMPETQKFILNLGYEPFYLPLSELDRFRDDQIAKWKKLIEISHIQMQ